MRIRGPHELRWQYLDGDTAVFLYDECVQGYARRREGPFSSIGKPYQWKTYNWLPYRRGRALSLEAAQEAVERVWAKEYPGFAREMRFDWSDG